MNNNNILLLCASPRHQGTSAMLLKRIQGSTGGELTFLPWKGNLEPLVTAMHSASTIVISGPCWVNTYPARLMEFLETAATSGSFNGQKLYGIINGGMPYTHTHVHGLKVLSLFARKCLLDYRGGFVLGGGAMLDGQPLEKHLSRKTIVPAFDSFIQHIREGSLSPDSLYEQAQRPPGWFMTRLFARMLTFMMNRNIRKFGHDPDAPNFYLSDKKEDGDNGEGIKSGKI